MIYVYLIGIFGCFIVGAFTPITWKRFSLIGFTLFLAFSTIGFIFFSLGSLVSIYDDWTLNHPNSRLQAIAFNKAPEWLVIGVFIIVMILALVSIAYNAVNLIT